MPTPQASLAFPARAHRLTREEAALLACDAIDVATPLPVVRCHIGTRIDTVCSSCGLDPDVAVRWCDSHGAETEEVVSPNALASIGEDWSVRAERYRCETEAA